MVLLIVRSKSPRARFLLRFGIAHTVDEAEQVRGGAFLRATVVRKYDARSNNVNASIESRASSRSKSARQHGQLIPPRTQPADEARRVEGVATLVQSVARRVGRERVVANGTHVAHPGGWRAWYSHTLTARTAQKKYLMLGRMAPGHRRS